MPIWTAEDHAARPGGCWDEVMVWHENAALSRLVRELSPPDRPTEILDVGCGLGPYSPLAPCHALAKRGVHAFWTFTEAAPPSKPTLNTMPAYSGSYTIHQLDITDTDAVVRFRRASPAPAADAVHARRVLSNIEPELRTTALRNLVRLTGAYWPAVIIIFDFFREPWDATNLVRGVLGLEPLRRDRGGPPLRLADVRRWGEELRGWQIVREGAVGADYYVYSRIEYPARNGGRFPSLHERYDFWSPGAVISRPHPLAESLCPYRYIVLQKEL